ncbi:relaxase/mobilization nuclease domain-containing protein [Porphyrobacter sp. AAP60]|uniref:relaxase/mobilization nuclease domain-containing protein n=1 Tax=Porphyrobacter sp. AAP60 TaxID=1523423 RepID=UPI0006B962D2|nr:relaxase/mobilization nuclease domain-containing protein [Porphyrobacter sp. AAP60]KPF63255.1 hypothetical protein IP79_10170 [Porphyrobacter sp. AAP60]
MIKVWQYAERLKGAAGGSTRQNLAFGTSLATGRYIFGFETYQDFTAMRDQVIRVGDYVADTDRASDRVAGRYAYNIAAGEPEEQIDELAVSAAAAGLKRFWHVVVSHRPGERLTDEQLEETRRIIAEVLGVDQCPMIWATHEDKAHLHEHGLIVSYLADTNEPVAFGESWWKEKTQIAIAICEHRLGLEPEPNRRYVADDSGVYHLLSASKVADADGKLVLGRKELRTMQREHDAFVGQNNAPDGSEPGDPWPLQRVAEKLAGPLISKSKSWKEVHERLASVGMRYLKVGATGVLEGADGAGPWAQTEGIRTAAGSAYAHAALGKLSRRLREDYSPPPPDLHVRAFVMPVFNRHADSAADQKVERRIELSEFKTLTGHLEADYKKAFKEFQNNGKGQGVNAARQKRKQAHVSELSAVKFAKSDLVSPSSTRASGKNAAPELPPTEIAAFIWGATASGDNASAEYRLQQQAIAAEYQVRRKDEQTRYYYLAGQLAFIERQRTIQIVAACRKARIDALKLARALFQQIRIAARQKVREGLARIAAELKLSVGPGILARFVADHLAAVERGDRHSIMKRADMWARTNKHRSHWRNETSRDRIHRRDRSARFTASELAHLRERNLEDHYVGQSPSNTHDIKVKASRTLDHAIRNSLMLASSRYHVDGVRFMDDAALLRLFPKERYAIQPNIQARLRAIEAIQIEERRWIAAAVLSGRVSIAQGDLKVAHARDKWAEDFWAKQKDDPTFHRLLMVSRMRPDRFQFDLDQRPDIAAWKSALNEQDHRLADGIADEIFVASEQHGRTVANRKLAQDKNSARSAKDIAEEYRQQLFETLNYHSAEVLRKTPGRFGEAYRGIAFKHPNATKGQWEDVKRSYRRIYGKGNGRRA